jgi:hypothetical protein
MEMLISAFKNPNARFESENSSFKFGLKNGTWGMFDEDAIFDAQYASQYYYDQKWRLAQ